jgi:hypothetical protein
MGIARATTFPTPASGQAASATRNSLDGDRTKPTTMSTPNVRQNFQDFRSPPDLSTAGTPESSSTSASIQQTRYNAQQLGTNNGLSDLGAMMFPSADPFAYPNQPMMEFDNIKQEPTSSMNHGLPVAPIYLSNGTGNNSPDVPSAYDDLEAQLFGSFPPYLMQGQQPFEAMEQMGTGVLSNQNSQEMNYGTGLNGDMNFDMNGIFSGEGDEWSNMLSDQRYG